MEELELTEIIKIIKKRKLIILICILASVSMAAIYLFQVLPVYQATVKVLIEPSPNKKISIQDILVPNDNKDAFLNTQHSLFKSRTLIKKLIRELHLESSAEFMDTSPFNIFNPLMNWIKSTLAKIGLTQIKEIEDLKTDPYSPLIDKFLTRLEVAPEENSKIVNIHFEGISPVLIARITNTLVDLYLRDQVDYQKTLEADAEKWLAMKGDELNRQSKDYFSRIQDFKKKQNMFELDGKRDFANQQYSETLVEIAKIRTKISKLNSLIQQLDQLRSSPQKMFYSIPESLKDKTIEKLRDSFIKEKIKFDNLSKVLKSSHPDLRQISIKIKAIEARIPGEMERLLKSLEIDYRASLKQEKDLKILQNRQKRKLLSLDNKTVQLNQMQQEAQSNKNLLEQMLTRGKELEIFSSYYSPPIRVVDRAEVPLNPVKPKVGLVLILALSVGIFAGLILVFLRESLDNSLNSEDDVERKLTFPLLGSVEKAGKNRTLNIPSNNQDFSFLRTRLLRLTAEKAVKSFLVTSSTPGEGKSTIVSHLAVSLARVGKKVLIIDADLENPKIHQFFNIDVSPGLIDALADSKIKFRAPIKTTFLPGVSVVPAGEPSGKSHASSDALFSGEFKIFLAELEQIFDVILVKAPPVLSMSHASILEEFCGGTLFVVAAGDIDKNIVQKALDQLVFSPFEIKQKRGFFRGEKDTVNGSSGGVNSNLKFFGIVLNKVNDTGHQAYYSYAAKTYTKKKKTFLKTLPRRFQEKRPRVPNPF